MAKASAREAVLMEPDRDGMVWLAAEALEEHERGQWLAVAVGMFRHDGDFERLAHGERDVAFLMPDRLVLVRLDIRHPWAYSRDQLTGVQFGDDDQVLIWVAGESEPTGFWAEAGYSEDFQRHLAEWLEPEGSSGWGVIVFGLVLVAAVIGLLYVFGPPV
jgi:hypothetical protein